MIGRGRLVVTGVVMTIVRSRGPGLLPLGLLPLHVAEDEPLLLNKFDFLQKNIYIEYASISSDNNHNITEYQLIGLCDIQQKENFLDKFKVLSRMNK